MCEEEHTKSANQAIVNAELQEKRQRTELRDDANRALALRIHLARKLQRVAVRKIGVGRADGKNDGVAALDKVQHHLANLRLNVGRLVADWHLFCRSMQREIE